MSKTIKLLFLLIFPIFLTAQNIDQIFSEKKEIYFSFNSENKTQLDRLSKIISLDHKTNTPPTFWGEGVIKNNLKNSYKKI